MKTFCLRRPAHWLAAGALGAVAWVFVADSSPRPAISDSFDIEICDIQYLRPAIKQQLARELVAGTRTLLDVAALFDALDCVPPIQTESQDNTSRDVETSPQERSCRRVIAAVQGDLHQQECDWRPAVARLEASLRQAKGRPGGLKLPEAAQLESTDALFDQARQRWHEFRRQSDAMRARQPATPRQTSATER